MLRVVFFQPEIPGNTGNAIRLSAVTGCELHLVRRLGFDLSDANLRRAGLDYHDLAHMTVHETLDDAWAALGEGARVFAFTARGETTYTDVRYERDDVLLFGPEATGLPEQVLGDPHVTARVKLPMLPHRRSLNLSNTAAIAVYEAWRQLGFAGTG